VSIEVDDLPATQALVAAGIAVVPVHGLTLVTVASAATLLIEHRDVVAAQSHDAG
jgi:hypothetical protein